MKKLPKPKAKKLPRPSKTLKSEHLPQYPKLRRALRISSEWLLALLALVGVGLSIYPRPTVSQDALSDPANSLSGAFTIANNTIVPINNIEVFLGVGRLKATAGKGAGVTLVGRTRPNETKIMNVPWQHRELSPDERQQVFPADLFRPLGVDAAADGEITIGVRYTPWLLPWLHREKEFRFITRRDAKGALFWSPQALD